MDTKILTDAGLTIEQAKIYSYLLEAGMSPAKVISAKTGMGRSLSYKVLKQLIVLGLAEKRDNVGKVDMFFPAHPQKLKESLEIKRNSFDRATKGLDAIYGQLASNFNMLLGKPNVQFFEGVDGIKNVYGDILDTGKDIFLISSPIDEHREKILHLIREQIQKQVEMNIRTKAITPLGSQKEIATPVGEDEKHLITRKAVPAEKLHVPAQIIIYGDKVAITNFKENMITVLIESKYIHETFRIMFEYIWNHG